MRLYTYPGAPSPQRVEWLLVEKGIEMPLEKVDLTQGEHLRPEFRAKSPNTDVPTLALDDGTFISQVPAICLYLEDRYPEPPLYGQSPEDRVRVIMWDHLGYINGFHAVAEVLRNSSRAMQGRPLVGPHNYDQIPALVDRGRQRVRNFFNDFNGRLAQSDYLAGDFFSMADITGYVMCNFARWIKEQPGEEHVHLRAWQDKISQRPAVEKVIQRR